MTILSTADVTEEHAQGTHFALVARFFQGLPPLHGPEVAVLLDYVTPARLQSPAHALIHAAFLAETRERPADCLDLLTINKRLLDAGDLANPAVMRAWNEIAAPGVGIQPQVFEQVVALAEQIAESHYRTVLAEQFVIGADAAYTRPISELDELVKGAVDRARNSYPFPFKRVNNHSDIKQVA